MNVLLSIINELRTDKSKMVGLLPVMYRFPSKNDSKILKVSLSFAILSVGTFVLPKKKIGRCDDEKEFKFFLGHLLTVYALTTIEAASSKKSMASMKSLESMTDLSFASLGYQGLPLGLREFTRYLRKENTLVYSLYKLSAGQMEMHKIT